MAYKSITNKGKTFIRNRCKMSGDRFKGSLKYALGRSNDLPNKTYTAEVYNSSNQRITTADTLADYIINWVEFYSREYQLDANIMAAQIYAESGYDLWRYSNGGKNGSSAMGISQFIDTAVYDIIIRNTNDFGVESQKLTNGLSGNIRSVTTIIPYYSNKDRTVESNKLTDTNSLQNRTILFQNIINNPEIMIKAQCFMMSSIGRRNNNLASSSLFAYNRGASLSSKSYNEVINNAVKNKISTIEGINYVNKIFKLLAGTYGNGIPLGDGFGKPYDEASTELDIEANNNLANSLILNSNFGTNDTIEQFIKTLHPKHQDLFRMFIKTIHARTPFTVQPTSFYRSFHDQEVVIVQNNSVSPPRPAAPVGLSYHQYGLAVDIVLNNGPKRYGFAQTKDEWIATGIPAIAESLGLFWGGTFSTYDPVHFDLRVKYPDVYKLREIAFNTYGTNPSNVKGNQITLPLA